MTRCLLVTIALLLGGMPVHAKTTVFVITDGEGVAGICRQEQVDPDRPELQALLTGEVNAAVRGFLSAGADDVIVWDGHDSSRTLSVQGIDARARLVIGTLGPTLLLDRGVSAVAFVGQHARANREAAVMAHSYSSLGIQRMLMNGKEVGEIETRAAVAGWFNLPVIFLSGDKAAADDLHAIVPDAETAVVKDGLGYYACVSLSAAAAQALIESKAALAMAGIGRVRPYRVDGPVSFEAEYTTRHTPSPGDPLPPGVERTGPRTLRFTGKDFLEAWTRWSAR